ncbi:hypothetical protein QQ045_007680 [Rhodiola kirilowii]
MDPSDLNQLFRRQQQRRRAANARATSFVMSAVIVASGGAAPEPPPTRRPNRQRQRGPRGENLLEDYFIERPIFSEMDFRLRYRMSRHLFARIMAKLCNHDEYWQQRRDAVGELGLLPEQKMTAAIRMLAYGSCADQCAEITRMGESTTLECMKKFCAQVVFHYKAQYLRSPNVTVMNRLLRRAEQRGFPGMLGSIDCMHWEWKNCPTAWQGAYSGRSHRPTIILEDVASFIGVPGAQNDLNVLYKSDIFDSYLEGYYPEVAYKVNGNTYENTYYLADGIYPRYSSFVKTISNPQNDAESLFSKKQESYQKDVERCFGILQSRWAIVRHAGLSHRLSVLKSIMLACIIMHNMIIKEEFVEEEFEESVEEDPHNPYNAFAVYDGPTDQNGNRLFHDPVERAQQSQVFNDRVVNLQSAYLHTQLQNDLVKRNWFLETGQQL